MLFADRRVLWLLMAPALAMFLFLAAWPILRLLLLALFSGGYGFADSEFVGTENFDYLFTDLFFRQSLTNTIYFAVVATAVEVLLGLALALLFNREFPGRRFAVPAMVLPFVFSTMVSASIWRSWFHYDFGFVNNIAAAVGLQRVAWLADPDLAMTAIIIMDVWQATAFTFLILLAGLQSIPREVQEASRVDGASEVQSFFTVTLPLLRRYIFLALLLRTIDTFKIFDKVYVTTKGGPGNATETLSLFVYKQAFRFSDLGMASAASLTLLAIGMIFAGVYAFFTLRRQR